MDHKDDMTHAEVNLDRGKRTAHQLNMQHATSGHQVELVIHQAQKPGKETITTITVALHKKTTGARLAITVAHSLGDLYVRDNTLWANGTAYDVTAQAAKNAADLLNRLDPDPFRDEERHS